MKTAIGVCVLLLVIISSGCTLYTGKPAPEQPEQIIRHIAYPTKIAATEVCTKILGEKKRACATWGGGDICTIHYVYNDWEALYHETAHCYYGSFHN